MGRRPAGFDLTRFREVTLPRAQRLLADIGAAQTRLRRARAKAPYREAPVPVRQAIARAERELQAAADGLRAITRRKA